MTAAERAELIRLRDQRQIDDEVLDEMLRQLDLEEAMLSRDEWDMTGGDPDPPGTGCQVTPGRRAESKSAIPYRAAARP